MTNRIKQIQALGQAIWFDYISRQLLDSGELADLVEEGVTGVTSNPTIFHHAIAGSTDYDDEITRLIRADKSTNEIYEALVVRDIRDAADVLRPVYNETHGRDGFVSIEVSPRLAHDTDGTIAEARRLHKTIERPNVMIKVPATPEGIPAISTLLGEGICVNVTLIFSIVVYEHVMQAYLDGLRMYAKTGKPLGLVSSVASFFVSRVDTLTDNVLLHRVQHGEGHLEPLMGLAAVANAKLAYAKFKQVFGGEQFGDLRAAGARVQRPLWASTSTKSPSYPDTKYVDPLIGVNTVNTVPPETLRALRDHAVVAQTIEQDLANAQAVMNELGGIKVDMEWVTGCLLEEGVKKFANSFDALMQAIDEKRANLQASV